MSNTLLNTSILKPQQHWIGYISLFSLMLYTLTVFSARGINRPIEVIFILSILFSLKSICAYEKENKGLWIYILIVVSFLLMLISNAIATASYPAPEVKHIKESLDFLRLLFFVFTGWWVIKKPRIVWWLLAFFSTAFIVKVVTNEHFLLVLSSSNTPRLDFGFSNAQDTAAFSGSLLITCISLSPIILTIKNYYFKVLAGALTLLLLLLTLVVMLASQTRAAWLGFFVVAGIAITPWAISIIGEKSSHIKLKLSLFFAGSMAILLIFASLNPTINSKVKYTSDRIIQLSQVEIKDIPTTSMGIRLHQWNLAIDLIKEKPISGHGGSSPKYLMQISDMPKRAIGSFRHFHNSYLQLGVAHGLGATFIFIFILSFLLYRLVKSYRNKHIGVEFFFWGVSWIVFFSIINIFESYVGSRTGYVLLLIFAGIIYGITSKPYNKTGHQQGSIKMAVNS